MTGSRALKAAFIFLIAIQVFFIYKRVHNYPFVIYDMYSRPVNAGATVPLYLFLADGDTLCTAELPIYQEGRLLNSVRLYDHYLRTGGEFWSSALEDRQRRLGHRFMRRSEQRLRYEAEDIEGFPDWLKMQVEQQLTGFPIDTLMVQCAIVDPHSTTIVSRRTVLRK